MINAGHDAIGTVGTYWVSTLSVMTMPSQPHSLRRMPVTRTVKAAGPDSTPQRVNHITPLALPTSTGA